MEGVSVIDRTQEEIVENWSDITCPLVSIRCITYNHEGFISQALDGFLSQKTTFPFEIVVHDDASTDKTANIIKSYEKKYPLIIHTICETENLYSRHDGSIPRIMNQHLRGKYVAFCEGDDYWTDENKLQRQFDFMECHPDYVLCYTNYDIYDQKRGSFVKNALKDEFKDPCSYTLEDWILHRGYTAPMTWFYRKSVSDRFERFGSLDGTFEMFAHFLASGKVKCMPEATTAVYRILPESAAHTTDLRKKYARVKSLRDVQLKMIVKYDCAREDIQRINETFYKESFKVICAVNDVDEKKKAKGYCKSFPSKLIFAVSNIGFFRKIMLVYYRIRLRK